MASPPSLLSDEIVYDDKTSGKKANYKLRLERWRLRKREDSMASSDDTTSVILTKLTMLDESFVSQSRSQTPDYFTDFNNIPSRTPTPVNWLDEGYKNKNKDFRMTSLNNSDVKIKPNDVRLNKNLTSDL